LRATVEEWTASGPRRARLRRARHLVLARRYLPVSDWRDQAWRPDLHHAPRLRRCRRARRQGALGVPRCRPDHTRNIDAVAGRRADQSHAPAGDAANAGIGPGPANRKEGPLPPDLTTDRRPA